MVVLAGVSVVGVMVVGGEAVAGSEVVVGTGMLTGMYSDSCSLLKRTFAFQSNIICWTASRVNDVNEHGRVIAWSKEIQTIHGGNHKHFR